MSIPKSNALGQLDFTGLYDVTDGNEEFMAKLLQAISNSLYSFPNDMQQAIDEQNLVQFAKLAHKFKSSTAYLGFPPLDELLSELEADNVEQVDTHTVMEEINLLSTHALEYVTDKLLEIKI
ncbi:Hpt domain-containing protein [Limibacter armeniacum]|uniref:Hpt domain-containing protein n=1 Tax=Limibacter armeniacum TaxID=466084 RepID=UPI002FE61B22